jgi:DNA-directed RNA polymerase subunit beta'
MSEYQTFGMFLVNDIMPDGYKMEGEVTKKVLLRRMAQLAKKEPDEYKDVIQEMKALGDRIATYDGISVGLEDIEPEYEERDAILNKADKALLKAKNVDERLDILVQAQEDVGDLAMRHKGTMAMMARAGGRGNKGQLMKSVASPVIVADQKGRGVPYLIRNSYAEGLTPGEYWIAANEARQNVITGQLATAEPGAQGKILTNLSSNLVIASEDCKTKNGISLPVKSPDILDRFAAVNKGVDLEYNTLLTTQVQQELLEDKISRIIVRSPMTCILREGVCKQCQGLDEKGNLHEEGTNVGIRAAHALSEPLTQLALSAKHGLRLAKRDTGPRGLQALIQYMESPKTFPHKAAIARMDGVIDRIIKAPQGGHYIHLGKFREYVPVGLDLKVKVGDRVEAGDALSDGILYPPDVVAHKGIGAGRDYLVNSVHERVFDKNMDRRHLELVMKRHLNHVKIDENEENDPSYLPGEVVDYNRFKETLRTKEEMPVGGSLLGEYLADDVLHYTAGTRVNSSVLADLTRNHIETVPVTDKEPKHTPVVAPMSRVPLYNPDWMQRLNHRLIKDSLLTAAHFGQESSVHSLNPMPAYAYGAEFGQGKGPGY